MTPGSEPTRQADTSADPTPDGVGSVVRWAGLAEAAAAAGVSVTAGDLARFAAYRDLLLDWNTRVNLTAITDPDEVERRLFLDALRMIPILDTLIATVSRRRVRLVDVGSGAGFPGLVLKIARPTLEVTLVEATGKKAAFLTHAVEALGLSGVVARQGRAEEIGHDPAHRAVYDLATARAVASLPALLELCAPLLRVGGHALFPKGIAIAGELTAGYRAATLLGVSILDTAPLPGGETRLIVAKKVAPTPDRFPRRAGLPARDPLGAGAEGRGPRDDADVAQGRAAR